MGDLDIGRVLGQEIMLVQRRHELARGFILGVMRAAEFECTVGDLRRLAVVVEELAVAAFR